MKDLLKGFLTITILFTCTHSYGQQTVSTPQFRREFLEDINHVRQKGCNCGTTYMPPAPPIVWNNQLEIASIDHATDMSYHHYFSHTSRDGRNIKDRLAGVEYTMKGYRSFQIGENIAMGQQSIAEVMEGWFKSPGHCKNLMNPGFKEVGVAEYNTYWVQDFGGRESFTAEQQRLIKSGKARVIENK
ncbi:MAG TPA: CAP domain-containing protein [Mucilaginibacter sp.]|jgi:uncharacterized protein YkwD